MKSHGDEEGHCEQELPARRFHGPFGFNVKQRLVVEYHKFVLVFQSGNSEDS